MRCCNGLARLYLLSVPTFGLHSLLIYVAFQPNKTKCLWLTCITYFLCTEFWTLETRLIIVFSFGTLGCGSWLSLSSTRLWQPFSKLWTVEGVWWRPQENTSSHGKEDGKHYIQRKVTCTYDNFVREVRTASCCSKQCVQSILTISDIFKTREHCY